MRAHRKKKELITNVINKSKTPENTGNYGYTSPTAAGHIGRPPKIARMPLEIEKKESEEQLKQALHEAGELIGRGCAVLDRCGIAFGNMIARGIKNSFAAAKDRYGEKMAVFSEPFEISRASVDLVDLRAWRQRLDSHRRWSLEVGSEDFEIIMKKKMDALLGEGASPDQE